VFVHVVDGTYELFRAYFGAPKATSPSGIEVGATRGIIRSLYSLVREDQVTHVACAFDHVIESFRNDLYAGYKTSAGVPEDLLSQFSLAERATHALGIVVWPMVEFEADDALATAAARWESAPGVDRVVICTPDKDVAQCVRDTRVVAFDRLRRRMLDEAGVVTKFGVPPASIPDWLALVGDSADGYPGVPRWGAKSAASMLAVYGHIDAIPDDGGLAAAKNPPVEVVIEFEDQLQQLLHGLDAEERQLVDLKLQQCTNEEVASQLGCSERTVRRMLKTVQSRLQRMLD